MTSSQLTETRQTVFQLAWNMVKKAGLSLSESLRKAWAAIKLKAQMSLQPTSFFFEKEDGSERFAVGYYGAAPMKDATVSVVPGVEVLNGLCMKYYDTLAGNWRSYRVDRLILV